VKFIRRFEAIFSAVAALKKFAAGLFRRRLRIAAHAFPLIPNPPISFPILGLVIPGTRYPTYRITAFYASNRRFRRARNRERQAAVANLWQ
jgi:hypothetical protein